MMHDVRIIPLDGRTHLASNLRSLARRFARPLGPCLIVETTNFNGKISFRGSDENLRVVERFTRTAPGLILYEFRIEDPTAFTAPWSAEVPRPPKDPSTNTPPATKATTAWSACSPAPVPKKKK